MFLRNMMTQISHGSKSLLQQFLMQSNTRSALGTGIRYLYSQEALGLDTYVNGRNKAGLQFQDLREKFYEKMTEFSDPASHNMVFTEDLKHILHLAENKEEDLKLVKQMILKFNSQNKELRFGAYTFGPVVMRLYHHLNQPNEALELFLNEDFKTFFTQNNSYHLLVDLLFKNERYEDVVKVFDVVEARQSQGTRYPRSVVIIYLAALYKMNTAEAFDRVVSLYKQLTAAGHNHNRRAICFAAALALNQAKYNDAIEFLALLPGNSSYVTMRSIKLLAMSAIRRYDDVLEVLQKVLRVDVPETKLNSVKQTVLTDVLDRLASDFDKLEDTELKTKFAKLHAQLKEFGHVSNETLDDMLTKEIQEMKPRYNQGFDDAGFTPSRFNADRTRSNDRKPMRRPGLSEMA